MSAQGRVGRALWVALFLLAAVAPARALWAADVADEADLRFNLGNDAYARQDFKGALEHFLVSNRLAPNRNVVFNIARTYEQLKLNADAYRYYLVALEGETAADARARVEDALARLAPNVAVLRVVTEPPGATVFIDRRDLGGRGNAPRALALAPGKHKVIVELPGYEPAEVDAPEMRVGTEVQVKVPLKQILGTVTVEGTPAGALVHLDREEAPAACALPCEVLAPPGRHTLYITKDGYQTRDVLVDVPVGVATTVRTRLAALTGGVVVNSEVRDALITIDGQPSGFTPAVLSVPVGPHVVRVTQSGFRPYEQRVMVAAGAQQRVEVQLSGLEEVTAASRSSESVDDAPASVTIISKQELRAMGYPTIAEAVRGVRGMYLSDDRSYASVGVRGFARPGDYGNRILVTVDGQPTNDNYIWSSYVGFDARVDLEDVERIEVVRGPGSVLYGTGAFFGVINLVMRDRSAPTHGEVGLSAVGDGVGRARATAVWRASDRAGVWSSVSVANGTGRDHYFPEYDADPALPDAVRDARGRVANGVARGVDGFQAATVSGRAWWKAFTAQWFLTSHKKALPTAAYESVFGSARTRFADTRAFLEARFEPQLRADLQLLTRAHANLYNFDGYIDYLPADGGPSRDTFRGKWVGLEQRAIYSPLPSFRLTAGAEVIRHAQAEQLGSSEADNASYIQKNGVFVPSRDDPFTVAAVYALGDFTPKPGHKIAAGARFDSYSNLDAVDFVSQLNPRLAYIMKPYARGNLKLLAGKAFRAPSVYELYYSSPQQIVSSGLKPEQIYSGEVELSHRFSSSVVGAMAGYANYVRDLVELQNRPDPTGGTAERQQYVNSGAPVLVLGAEAEVRREWRQGWMVAASYSLSRTRYLDDPTRRDVPNSLGGDACDGLCRLGHLASVKAAVPIIGRTLMGMTRLSIEGPRPDRNFLATDAPQRMTDAGVVWDLVLSGEVERYGVRYAFGAYNVADHRYDTVPSGEFRQRTIVQSGRTFLASAGLSF